MATDGNLESSSWKDQKVPPFLQRFFWYSLCYSENPDSDGGCQPGTHSSAESPPGSILALQTDRMPKDKRLSILDINSAVSLDFTIVGRTRRCGCYLRQGHGISGRTGFGQKFIAKVFTLLTMSGFSYTSIGGSPNT